MTDVDIPATMRDYMSGSSVSTHGIHFYMLFNYESEEENAQWRDTKSRFRSYIKEFVKSGQISGWSPFPVVYGLTSDSYDVSNDWTSESCERWRPYYPQYSWMN